MLESVRKTRWKVKEPCPSEWPWILNVSQIWGLWPSASCRVNHLWINSHYFRWWQATSLPRNNNQPTGMCNSLRQPRMRNPTAWDSSPFMAVLYVFTKIDYPSCILGSIKIHIIATQVHLGLDWTETAPNSSSIGYLQPCWTIMPARKVNTKQNNAIIHDPQPHGLAFIDLEPTPQECLVGETQRSHWNCWHDEEWK